ncbi:MAG: YjbQ family protein [Phycisphaerae bacterium]|nr:YjbQ family protein [Phycisphaerae bacterium]
MVWSMFGFHGDYDEWLEWLAPHEPISQYRRNPTGEKNSDAHLGRPAMSRQVVFVTADGKLDFGPVAEDLLCGIP